MRPILFAPHNDDETLWASFLIQRYSPLVVVVFKSVVQDEIGITAQVREWETRDALHILQGCDEAEQPDWQQWPFPDDGTVHREEIKDAMLELLAEEYSGGGVMPVAIVPAWSKRGHRDHNMVNVAALEVFGDVIEYLTYEFGGDKQRRGVEVVPEREMILRKLRALACYESQVARGPHRFWMMDLVERTRSRVVA